MGFVFLSTSLATHWLGIWVFPLLVIGVILQIICYVQLYREQKRWEKETRIIVEEIVKEMAIRQFLLRIRTKPKDIKV